MWIARSVDLRQVADRLSHVPPGPLLTFLALMMIITLLASWRWMVWLYPVEARAPFGNFVHATMLSYFYNLFLPSTVGGDAMKWTTILHLGFTKKELVVSVIADRVSGLLSIVISGGCSLLYSLNTASGHVPFNVAVVLFILFASTVIMLAFIFSPIVIGGWPGIRRIIFISKIETYLKTRRKTLWLTLAISVVIQVISYYSMFILSNALELNVNLLNFFIFGSIISLLLILPISFSGFGVTDISFLYFFLPLGAPRAGILAFTSLLNTSKFVLAFLGWCTDFIIRFWLFLRRR